ncbi:hypothetical protein fh0823_08980 [Francisella halioticida]|uniref:carbohydrate-binding protein n=1 Tax=Francisella halioticida TaxID=549298 RepID=UPI001AFA5620|nr:carbohydrate-binding protein [Francisella halioticida]BCD90759.1 hypothetical protein fh0823_08980 [Francisella halioticida]
MQKSILATLIALGGVSMLNAAEISPWSTSDLSSYVAGTTVTDNGKTYECKGWPASGWCQIAAYKQSWDSDAWKVTGSDPTPTPGDSVQEWNSNTVYNPSDSSKPSQAIYDGNLYTAKWWTQGENPSQSGQWGVWKNESPVVEQGKGTVSIVLPAKPSFIADGKLADVQILKNSAKVAEVKDAQWGIYYKLRSGSRRFL